VADRRATRDERQQSREGIGKSRRPRIAKRDAVVVERRQRGIRMRGHIIFYVQGMKAIHANQQHVLDLVATQFVVTRACRNRSTEQGETQSNRCDAFLKKFSFYDYVTWACANMPLNVRA